MKKSLLEIAREAVAGALVKIAALIAPKADS